MQFYNAFFQHVLKKTGDFNEVFCISLKLLNRKDMYKNKIKNFRNPDLSVFYVPGDELDQLLRAVVCPQQCPRHLDQMLMVRNRYVSFVLLYV